MDDETYLHVKGLASPGSLKVKVTDPDGHDVSVTHSPSENPNFHTFRFVPTKAGKHTVNIDKDGVPVPGSPFFPVIIGKADPSRCTPEGPGLLAGRVGKPTRFTVDCHRAGPGELKVDINSPSGTNMPVTLSGTKKYDAEYTPSEIGPHNIQILFAGHQVKGSPFIAIVTDPSKVTVDGMSGCKMGDTAQFRVETEEAGPGQPEVSVRGPGGPIGCSVKEVDEHVYQCQYTPEEAGPHNVIVRFAEEDVPGSPFSTMVSESCYPDKVILRNLPYGNVKAGNKYSVTADATEAGNGTLAATLRGPSGPVRYDMQEAPQKVYSIKFVPTECGNHTLDVVFADTPVPGSPVSFYVVDPSGTQVTPPTPGPLGAFITDQPYVYHVKAPDEAEKVTTKACGQTTGDEPTLILTDCGGGEYNISLTAAQPDNYDVDIYYGSDPVPGSPYRLQVLEKPHPDRVSCGNLVPESPVWMSVDTSKAGAGKLTATCNGDKSGTVPCTVTDEGAGKQRVAFNPPAPDVYWVNVYWNDTEVPRSPFRVSTIPTDAGRVRVDGPHYPQMHEGPVTAVCDVSNAGDGKLTASCFSKEYGEVPVQVSEESGGKVDVQFAPPGRGHYKLNVMWQDDDVPGSPFNISLDPPRASKVRVDGPHASETGLGPVLTSIDASEAGDGELAVTAEGNRTGPVNVSVTEKKPKNYAAVFNAKQPDTYNVNVLWSGQPVPRSPFPVRVDLGEELVTIEDALPVEASYLANGLPYDPDEDSTYHEPKLEDPIPVFHVGESLSVDVDKEDEESPGPVTASCQGATAGQIPVELISNPDGTAQVNINPRVPDLYVVDIKMGSEHVPGSPFKVRYLPPPSDASKCKVYGLPDPEKKLVSREEIVYGVDASQAGSGNLSVQSEGPSGAKKNSQLQVMSTDGADFKIVYTPGAAGTHKHFIYWSKEAIPESPVVFEVQPRDIPVYPFGPVTMDFVFPGIKAKDISGHAIYEPTEKKLKLSVDKSKTERDKFHVTFKPTDPGMYEVHVNNHKLPVKGSPYEVRVLEPPNAGKVQVTGLTDAVCRVGDTVAFSLDCTDAGNGELLVRDEGPTRGGEQSQLDVVDRKNNCFDGTFVPSSVGDHLIHVKWSEKPVPGSPFKVKVLPEKDPDGTSGLTILELGQPMDIKLTDNAEDEVYASAEGDNTGPAHVSVQLDEDDKHQVLFLPVHADDYTVTVMLNNSHIDGSPFRIKVLEKTTLFADAELGTPRQGLEAEVNKPVNFVLSPGPIEDAPEMKVSGPYGPLDTQVTDTGEGRYIAHFKPEVEGEYLVAAKSNGEHLKGSPYTVLVRDSAKSDPSKCFILPQDLQVMSTPYEFNHPCTFRVSTLNAGPGTLNVTSRGPAQAEVNITDGHDGVYSVAFTPSAPGKYSLDVTWDDTPITGSPVSVVYKGERKSRVLTGLDLSSVPFRVGKSHKFKVHCDEIGEGDFSVIVDPSTAANITIRDLGKLTYHVTLVPRETGEKEVSVTHSNQHILGSPFKCTFVERGDASKCRLIEESEEQQHEVGEMVTFLVTTEGAGPGTLTAEVENVPRETTDPAKVEKLTETRYRVSFDPGQGTEYLLSIKYDDAHIVGSPFKLTFADQPDASQCRAEGEGLQSAQENQPNEFMVFTDGTSAELQVEVEGTFETVKPEVSPTEEGVYHVSYMPKFTGEYDIRVLWNGAHIPNSPFKVRSYRSSDASQVSVVKESVKDVIIGKPFAFLVDAKEAGSDGELTAMAIGPNKSVEGTVSDNGDGTYNVTFDPPESGKYQVQVRWDGQHVVGSPFKVKVSSPPMPDKVRAHGPGLNNGIVGQEGNFVVETKDAGAGTLAVRVHGPKGAFKINMKRDPDNDRTIHVRYDPTLAGEYTVDITWSDTHIPGSPFKVLVNHAQDDEE